MAGNKKSANSSFSHKIRSKTPNMTLHKMLQLVIRFFLNFECKECKSAPAFLWMQILADCELAWAEFPVDVID